MKLTREQVEAMLARAEKATPGEWLVHQWGRDWQIVEGAIREQHAEGIDMAGQRILAYSMRKRNADFAAAARTDVPALAADWLEMERLLRELRERADVVMAMLDMGGDGIVPHLLDTDENPGQFLRETLDEARAFLEAKKEEHRDTGD